jgi:cytochrome P450 family 130
VLSELAAADRGGIVSFEESISICYLLFLAGIETTASLISNALLLLAERPAQAAFLRERPQAMARAVEEFLRFESPVQHLARSTLRSVELHGVEIPAGARVMLVHGAANRDGRRFPDPDVLDFGREVKRTLAFGEGIHFCLGAPLARPEARIALSRLLARADAFELCGKPQRAPTSTAHGHSRLPVTVRWA